MCYMQCMRYCDKLQMGLCFTLFRKNLGEINFTTVFPHRKATFLWYNIRLHLLLQLGIKDNLKKKNPPFYQKSLAFFRGFKTSWQLLEFCQLFDNMPLVVQVKIITFWPLLNCLLWPAFAEADAFFKTFWNPWFSSVNLFVS